MQTKQRGATKAQLQYRTKFQPKCPCVVLMRDGERYYTVSCSLPLIHNGACQPAETPVGLRVSL